MICLLGVDLGTSGTKTVLFDAEGREVASQSVEYPLYQPQNGWAEQDPRDWWNAAVSTIRGVLEKSGVNPGDVKGLGISGQMHGLVLLDENGEPLGRSLLWCDGRTQRECDEITQAVGEKRLIEIAANPALTGFTAGKILWVRRHRPELFARARHALLPKDYVRYRLTGVLAQEISDASGTNLLDVPARRWSKEIMDKLGLSLSLLPPLVESCEAAGAITPEAAELTGLRAGTVVAGGAGDNMAAAIGTGVAESGRAFTTIGTSGVVFAHSDTVRIDPEGRVHTFCAAVPGAYTNMSCTLAAGLSLKWYRDQFCQAEREAAAQMGVDPYDLMNREAAQSPVGANRLLFLPYLMGERSPINDTDARGTLVGMTMDTTRADLTQAVLEGVAFAIRDSLEVARSLGLEIKRSMLCGGGARSPLWRRIMANVLDMELTLPVSEQGPGVGGAMLAMVCCGEYPSVDAVCSALVRVSGVVLPEPELAARYEPRYRAFRQIYPALRAVFPRLG